MKKQFRDFEYAREFARTLGLKNQKEWQKYCKSGNKPNDIPADPISMYKKDFKGVGDWIGTRRRRGTNFLLFSDAKKFVHNLKLKGQVEWFEYCKSGNKPDDIPASPNTTYKNNGWKSYGDWIGNDNIAVTKYEFLPFQEAREFVIALNLKNVNEWREYCKSGNKPDNIPSSPWRTYKEWKKK